VGFCGPREKRHPFTTKGSVEARISPAKKGDNCKAPRGDEVEESGEGQKFKQVRNRSLNEEKEKSTNRCLGRVPVLNVDVN